MNNHVTILLVGCFACEHERSSKESCGLELETFRAWQIVICPFLSTKISKIKMHSKHPPNSTRGTNMRLRKFRPHFIDNSCSTLLTLYMQCLLPFTQDVSNICDRMEI